MTDKNSSEAETNRYEKKEPETSRHVFLHHKQLEIHREKGPDEALRKVIAEGVKSKST